MSNTPSDAERTVPTYLVSTDVPCRACPGVIMAGAQAAIHPDGWQHPHHTLGVTSTKVAAPSTSDVLSIFEHRLAEALEARNACQRENSRLALENQQLKVKQFRGIENFNYEQLDPGIRETVKLLHANGFNTTDSGDGVSKPADWYASGCAMAVPNVMIETRVEHMIADAHRVHLILGREWVVQAMYATDNCRADLIATKDAESRR